VFNNNNNIVSGDVVEDGLGEFETVVDRTPKPRSEKLANVGLVLGYPLIFIALFLPFADFIFRIGIVSGVFAVIFGLYSYAYFKGLQEMNVFFFFSGEVLRADGFKERIQFRYKKPVPIKTFDYKYDELMQRIVETDEPLEGHLTLLVGDSPSERVLIATVGLNFADSISYHADDVDGKWIRGKGKISSGNVLIPVPEKIRDEIYDVDIPMYFLVSSEPLCRAFGRFLEFPARTDYREVLKMLREYETFKTKRIISELTAKESEIQQLRHLASVVQETAKETADDQTRAFLRLAGDLTNVKVIKKALNADKSLKEKISENKWWVIGGIVVAGVLGALFGIWVLPMI